ncbi:MAG: hypothetical protein HY528_02935 [Chloroflexi bacterium]|nr:hypothetical protein [Chloroflexota bacterium]
MSKKVKVLVSVVAAVTLLTVGSTVAVMAKGAESAPPPSAMTQAVAGTDNSTLLARVAQILGIPQDTLVNAFKQAQQERRADATAKALEKLSKALDKAVAKGRLTQEQADQIKAWLAQRPAFLGPGFLQRFFSNHNLPGGHMKGFPGGLRNGGHMKDGPKGHSSENATQNN